MLFATGIVFVVGVLLAAGLFFWGQRKNSKALKLISVLPVVCGLVVFAPMVFLLVLWIGYWTFGDTSSGSTKSQSQSPGITNYAR